MNWEMKIKRYHKEEMPGLNEKLDLRAKVEEWVK